jgi:hypothetical protein
MTFAVIYELTFISFGREVPATGGNLGTCASKYEYTDLYSQSQKY